MVYDPLWLERFRRELRAPAAAEGAFEVLTRASVPGETTAEEVKRSTARSEAAHYHVQPSPGYPGI